MPNSHYNQSGSPKNRYRTRDLAIEACNRRGWYNPYRCGVCKDWHISRSKLIRYDSKFMDNWRRLRPYFDTEMELGRRVASNHRTWDENPGKALRDMKDAVRRKFPDAPKPRPEGGLGEASAQEVELPTSDVNTVANGVSPRK